MRGTEIENRLLDILSSIRPEVDFSCSDDYVGDGLIDSFDIILLTAELDKNFSVSIAGTDITPENFANINSIANLLIKYQQ